MIIIKARQLNRLTLWKFTQGEDAMKRVVAVCLIALFLLSALPAGVANAEARPI